MKSWSWFPSRLFSNIRFLNLSLETRAVLMSLYGIADETGAGPLGVPGMVRVGIVDTDKFKEALADLSTKGFLSLDENAGSWLLTDYRDDDPGLVKARVPRAKNKNEAPATPPEAA